MPNFTIPKEIELFVDQATYNKWLKRKDAAHLKRDRARGATVAAGETYKAVIHKAVIDCGNVDPYTAEKLDWSLIGR